MAHCIISEHEKLLKEKRKLIIAKTQEQTDLHEYSDQLIIAREFIAPLHHLDILKLCVSCVLKSYTRLELSQSTTASRFSDRSSFTSLIRICAPKERIVK